MSATRALPHPPPPGGAPDLLDGTLYAGDPEPVYAWLRAQAPVYRDETNALWAVSRHADVAAVERHPERFCSSHGYRPNLPAEPSMIGQDDPRHRLQRRLLSPQLTPRAVRALEPRVRSTVTALIDAFARDGRCDLVRDFAVPLPVITIIERIGFDPGEWPVFARISETTNAAGGGPRYIDEAVFEQAAIWSARITALIEARREERRDDFVSRMLDARDDGSLERDDTAIGFEALLLLNGGSDTTRHVIGGAMRALLEHPDQLAALRADPARIPAAVEEFVRWVTPILNMQRTATRDCRIADVRIREGDEVLMLFASANRDEAVFEDPQRFDTTRAPNPHLAFGLGTHFCLGASLARLELRVAFEELLRRLHDVRIAPGAQPRIVPNAFVRGLDSLELEFRPEP